MNDKELHSLRAWVHQLRDDLKMLEHECDDMLEGWVTLSKQVKHAMSSIDKIINLTGEAHKTDEEENGNGDHPST